MLTNEIIQDNLDKFSLINGLFFKATFPIIACFQALIIRLLLLQ